MLKDLKNWKNYELFKKNPENIINGTNKGAKFNYYIKSIIYLNLTYKFELPERPNAAFALGATADINDPIFFYF